DHTLVWDGRDAAAAIVADGRYALVITTTSGCGRSTRLTAVVEVDTRPPEAVISLPVPGDALAGGVDVRGTAADLHFRSYELSYGLGAAPAEWLPITSGVGGVPADGSGIGFLGHWNGARVQGTHTLRLRAL